MQCPSLPAKLLVTIRATVMPRSSRRAVDRLVELEGPGPATVTRRGSHWVIEMWLWELN